MNSEEKIVEESKANAKNLFHGFVEYFAYKHIDDERGYRIIDPFYPMMSQMNLLRIIINKIESLLTIIEDANETIYSNELYYCHQFKHWPFGGSYEDSNEFFSSKLGLCEDLPYSRQIIPPMYYNKEVLKKFSDANFENYFKHKSTEIDLIQSNIRSFTEWQKGIIGELVTKESAIYRA